MKLSCHPRQCNALDFACDVGTKNVHARTLQKGVFQNRDPIGESTYLSVPCHDTVGRTTLGGAQPPIVMELIRQGRYHSALASLATLGT
jgi:hypothetical protein